MQAEPSGSGTSGNSSDSKRMFVNNVDPESSDVSHVDTDDDDDEDLDYYYSFNDDESDLQGVSGQLNNNEDPEYTPYDCLSHAEAEQFLNEVVQAPSDALKVSISEAKLLLSQNNWSLTEVSNVLSQLSTNTHQNMSTVSSQESIVCDVCANLQSNFSQLSCGHSYCDACWQQYFEQQITHGSSVYLSCMSINCTALAPENFVLKHVTNNSLRNKYRNSLFQQYIFSHPQLRFCPGKNCKIIIRTAKLIAKKCVCTSCKLTFCFQCGGDYHSPTDCQTIKKWLTKCADDSETANYISAHTKDCPKCNICIEKNGGCNHMQCYKCKHDFCWMCLGSWRAHGSEYYECSKYKEDPSIAHESAHAQAREALKKYLHYYERWENHSKSMKLEAQTLEKIKSRITQKVMEGSGTWIDWQYLLDASVLLAKCRYTLQYTYPFAYYMEPCPRKDLFEYQQAQLEAEIENLSWKIEHAETTDRGDLENQIDIAQKRRTSLLKDFVPS